jgi:hypothetical protein
MTEEATSKETGTQGPEEQVRAFARSCVRAGLLSHDEQHAAVAEAIARELPDRAEEAVGLADTWVAQAHDELRADQLEWPESTDYERLQSAFAELELLDVSVLQATEDRAAAERLLREGTASGAGLRAVVWFTPEDVWRAVDEGVLTVRLLPGEGTEVEDLTYDVLGVAEKHGLRGVSQDGHVELDAQWQKPLAG